MKPILIASLLAISAFQSQSDTAVEIIVKQTAGIKARYIGESIYQKLGDDVGGVIEESINYAASIGIEAGYQLAKLEVSEKDLAILLGYSRNGDYESFKAYRDKVISTNQPVRFAVNVQVLSNNVMTAMNLLATNQMNTATNKP